MESDPAAAIDHFRAAEEQQWHIGTWATGAGEGLASMFAVYEIQLERAAVHRRLGQLAEVARIEEGIARDPNGLGKRLLRRR